MTEKEYYTKLEKIKKDNIQWEYRNNLKNEKKKYRPKSKVETSKLIAVYLFLLLNTIVIYTMFAMWIFADFTYLGVLISDIAAQVLIYAIYCMKAYKAKKSEEEMKFKREHPNTLGNILNAGAESHEYVPVNGDVETFIAQNENIVG